MPTRAQSVSSHLARVHCLLLSPLPLLPFSHPPTVSVIAPPPPEPKRRARSVSAVEGASVAPARSPVQASDVGTTSAVGAAAVSVPEDPPQLAPFVSACDTPGAVVYRCWQALLRKAGGRGGGGCCRDSWAVMGCHVELWPTRVTSSTPVSSTLCRVRVGLVSTSPWCHDPELPAGVHCAGAPRVASPRVTLTPTPVAALPPAHTAAGAPGNDAPVAPSACAGVSPFAASPPKRVRKAVKRLGAPESRCGASVFMG